jgi:hypothetical protein
MITRVVITPFQACTHSLIERVRPGTDTQISAWGLLADRGSFDWSKNILVHTHVTLEPKFLPIQELFMKLLIKSCQWHTVVYDPLLSMISSYTRGYDRGRYIVDQYVYLATLALRGGRCWLTSELGCHRNQGNRGPFHAAYEDRDVRSLSPLPDYDYLKSKESVLKPYLCRYGLTDLPWYEET